jgi:hypothetical protein
MIRSRTRSSQSELDRRAQQGASVAVAHAAHLQLAPLISNVQSSTGLCGVDPADRTGK